MVMKYNKYVIGGLLAALILAGPAAFAYLHHSGRSISMTGSVSLSDASQLAGHQLELRWSRSLDERQRMVWPLVRRLARAEGLDPALVMSVIQVESCFQPAAKSPQGAVGLMQIHPATARHLGLKDPWDPASNLSAGIGYLSDLLDYFDGDHVLALAAYNAGPRKVVEAGGVPDIEETRNFVFKVLDQMDSFRTRFQGLALR